MLANGTFPLTKILAKLSILVIFIEPLKPCSEFTHQCNHIKILHSLHKNLK